MRKGMTSKTTKQSKFFVGTAWFVIMILLGANVFCAAFSTPQLVKAKKRYEREIEEAKARYQREFEEAKERYEKYLRHGLKLAIKNEDMDEANRIKDALEELTDSTIDFDFENETKEDPKQEEQNNITPEWLVGQWVNSWNGYRFAILEDMTVIKVKGKKDKHIKGTIEIVDNEVVITWRSLQKQYLTIKSNTLLQYTGTRWTWTKIK